GHLGGAAAAAESHAGVAADQLAVGTVDFESALHEVSIAHRANLHRPGLRLLSAAVVPDVVKRPGRAEQHGFSDRVRLRAREIDPRPAPWIEDAGERADALTAVNAALREPEDADAIGVILAGQSGGGLVGARRLGRRAATPFAGIRLIDCGGALCIHDQALVNSSGARRECNVHAELCED